jgi:hypothetical protein
MTDKKRIEQIKTNLAERPRRRPRRPNSEVAQRDAAKRVARRITITKKARAALRQAQALLEAGNGDRELRVLRDTLVEELFGLRYERVGKPLPRLH